MFVRECKCVCVQGSVQDSVRESVRECVCMITKRQGQSLKSPVQKEGLERTKEYVCWMNEKDEKVLAGTFLWLVDRIFHHKLNHSLAGKFISRMRALLKSTEYKSGAVYQILKVGCDSTKLTKLVKNIRQITTKNCFEVKFNFSTNVQQYKSR